MADKKGIPLESIAGFLEAARVRLAELWITTAEDLVGAAMREDGAQGLAEFLGMSESDVDGLVGQAMAVLPPDVSFATRDIQAFGLGALDEPGEAPRDVTAFDASTLPAQVDLHERFPPVRNQGGRGTCVAHATVAVREYLADELHRPGGESTQSDLSEQFVYWACKERDNYAGSGTWIHHAMAVLQEQGVCTEQVWPYNAGSLSGNEGQGPPPADAESQALAHRIDSSESLHPRWTDALRQHLAQERPVAFAVPVFTYWFSEPVSSTGDIRLPLSTDKVEGGHAMVMVGYEDDPDVPGGGYFLVRNSWGTNTWGRDNAVAPGYARIPYAYMAEHGRSAHVAYRQPAKPKLSWWQELLRRLFG
jgi:C1A family cysteine protease